MRYPFKKLLIAAVLLKKLLFINVFRIEGQKPLPVCSRLSLNRQSFRRLYAFKKILLRSFMSSMPCRKRTNITPRVKLLRSECVPSFLILKPLRGNVQGVLQTFVFPKRHPYDICHLFTLLNSVRFLGKAKRRTKIFTLEPFSGIRFAKFQSFRAAVFSADYFFKGFFPCASKSPYIHSRCLLQFCPQNNTFLC